jgi:hypothetical protein
MHMGAEFNFQTFNRFYQICIAHNTKIFLLKFGMLVGYITSYVQICFLIKIRFMIF